MTSRDHNASPSQKGFTGSSEQLKILLNAIERKDSSIWNDWRAAHPLERLNLAGADLSSACLSRLDLKYADLSRVCLKRAWLGGANLESARLVGAELEGTYLGGANLNLTDLRGANCKNTDFVGANLRSARIEAVNLDGATLCGAELMWTRFKEASLTNADLERSLLVETVFQTTTIWNCRVYGISAWNLSIDDATVVKSLIITPVTEPSITVDDLEVAQFIYLLINNKNIRRVIDTITSKVVLILGRFTADRKVVLDAIREQLRKQGDYVPVIFDFDQPMTRDTHEAVTTLARMARFVIADITDPKSIPQELVSIVEQLPSLPVQPILCQGGEPWGMYDHIKRYPWVLPLQEYTTREALLSGLDELVIAPAEAKVGETRGQTL